MTPGHWALRCSLWSELFSCHAARSFRERTFSLSLIFRNLRATAVFLIDLKNDRTSAHYAAHGRSNGNNLRATKFRGFRSDHDMVPLGPLRTAAADASVTSHYRTIADKYTGQVWNGLNSARLEGVASYNSYINSVPGVVWVIHPNWYVSAGYRKNNPGMLGRSLGCITLDPEVNNAIVNRLGNGALIYVTVGDDPVERYL